MTFKLSNKINADIFISNPTPESSYILGLWWADGYVSKTTNSINLQCLKEDIDYFYPIFQTTGKYNLYFRKQPLNDKISGTINCSSKGLHDFLVENDYINKSTKSYHNILNSIPKILHPYFFLGLSDGDGCFYYNEKNQITQYIIASTYEQDWESMELLCLEMNIKYRINRTEREGGRYSQFQINNHAGIILFGDYIYQGKLGLDRKRDKFNIIKKYINSIPTYKIFCYDKHSKLIMEFNSLNEASRWMDRGRNVSTDIRDVCIGRQKTAFGYIWKRV
jgi:hypothetical protein